MKEMLRYIEELPYSQLVILLALVTLEKSQEAYGWALLDRLSRSNLNVAESFKGLVDRELVWAADGALILQPHAHPEALMVDVIKGDVTLMADVDQALDANRIAINALYNQKRKSL